ncbi:MAG: DUF488 domain-containing protein [Castellaniella sp.]|uniref:DUF488 domain-containing protein n=1 Tax=Castellaniella sp. TaxID=1955812 RepID=UPI001216AC6A|nr:DUF488 domain-containing protein [Castellaniella sp.]TAN29295.1 MAG: DUF488 domain-containing protein [Castellaniella sp.]
MSSPLYTIGHSTHDLDSFVRLLQESGIQLLADVRTVPRSRTNPQFNRDTLPASLAPFNIAYQHMESLGGLRGKSRTTPPQVNGFWENDSFHHYADYALTETFRSGLDELITQSQRQPTAIMCSEAVWWRCHRRIIADYFLARQIPVLHIMGAGHVDPAHLTPGAVVQEDLSVLYPPAA